ncbi:MAG: lipocalin family protein [Pseudomonadales bacterium]|nr:lipocalin family protein [Pseudomonadales bacterium]
MKKILQCIRYLALFTLPATLSGCLGYPAGVAPVSDFDINRYLGKWYEIARLDHPFERGLSEVTAEYSLREDDSVKVLNQGYSAADSEWESATGVARFVTGTDQGYLKVSFFGPFYGSYVVFELDHDNYEWAFVSGPNHDYLWLLSRSPHPDEALKARFVSTAKARGFDTTALIFVEHGALAPPSP